MSCSHVRDESRVTFVSNFTMTIDFNFLIDRRTARFSDFAPAAARRSAAARALGLSVGPRGTGTATSVWCMYVDRLYHYQVVS